MASKLLPLAITAKKDLKPVQTKMRFKKADVRQCRLCLRVLPRGDVRFTSENDGYDFRRKIADAVGVKITDGDKVQGVCGNCLLLVETVNQFRESCRKADTIHRKRLLMMHPGKWTSEESKKMLEDCYNLVKRNRCEMDALFKCFERKEEEAQQHSKPEVNRQSADEPVSEKDDNDDTRISTVDDTLDRLPNTQVVALEIEIQQDDVTPLPTHLPEPERVPDPVYPSGKRIIMCDLCGQFMDGSRMRSHRNKHLGLRPAVCPHADCGKRFFSNKILSNHLRVMHLGVKSMVECTVCHRKVKGTNQLRIHMMTHGENRQNSRKSACNVCGKLFYKSYLKDHMAVHTGLMAYPCGVCDRSFAAMNNLTTHYRKVHPDALYNPRDIA